MISSRKEERVAAAKILHGPTPNASRGRQPPESNETFIQDVENALYTSKIISYAQGFALLRAMAKESGWTINNGAVALMWRGGCIIRSVFLGKIKEAFDRNPQLTNLLVDPYFAKEIEGVTSVSSLAGRGSRIRISTRSISSTKRRRKAGKV